MTPGEARALLGMIKGAWPSLYLDDYGTQAWQSFLVEEDVEVTTEAYTKLSYMKETPTIADFRGMIRKIVADRLSARPALPEPTFKRELPAWVKGWLCARAAGDFRVWPQQKPGYDKIQNENPSAKAHVWPDQDPMPEEKQRWYEDRGQGLDASALDRLLTASRVI